MTTSTINPILNLPSQIRNILPLLKELNVEQKLSLVHFLSENSENENTTDTQKMVLQRAIKDGLDSPRITNFDFDTHLEQLKSEVLG